MPSDIERAEHVLNNLRQKREVLVARGHSLGEERTQLAFAAHASDDAKARRRLDEINREAALHDSELRSIDAAIAEATERVNRAQQAEARKVDRQKAEALRKHVDQLAEVPAFIDEHLEAALSGLLAYDRGVAELHTKFHVAFPADVQTRLGMVAVIATFLQKLPQTWFNEIAGGVRYLSPAQRKTASSYFAQVEPSLRTAIKQRLGEVEPEKETAA
jgi:hypothetical protein